MNKAMELEAIIGLEIHVQLKTKSKMFCGCDNASVSAAPNTLICPVCTGHPGTLPAPNTQAVDWAVMSALALGCTVNEHSKFDRKHYFYPDLPKGYQISQYDEPIGVHGEFAVTVGDTERVIGIERLHLEEDVGKLTHVGTDSFVDFNRAGTPLMEIVTEPDFRSPEETKEFLQQLQLVMRYLGVSDADMEKGQLRCDANVSLRPRGETKLYPKTEVKNVNSFRNVERALTFEIKRQTAVWESGAPLTDHETRGWDAILQETVEQRRKESASDYRYFPEPDIPPLHFTPEFVAAMRAKMPEMPAARRERFMKMYGLTVPLADALVKDMPLAAKNDCPFWKYFEETITEFREYGADEKGAEAIEAYWEGHHSDAAGFIAKFLLNRISSEHRTVKGLPVKPENLARLLWMVHAGTITMATAAALYEKMADHPNLAPHTLVKDAGLETMGSEQELEPILRGIMKKHPKQAAAFKAGKTTLLQFFIGQAMKVTKGKAQASVVKSMLEKMLKK